MAESTELFCPAVAAYIQEQTDIAVEYVSGIPWQEREQLFDAGEIQILWLCGLPYVYKSDLTEIGMELLAVPVPAGTRYDGRPIYFSDVVVRSNSRYRNFLDLRGSSWAYNERRSHSGYNVVRAHLAGIGETEGFFGSLVASGKHSASVAMILSGRADGAAIDSTMLKWIFSMHSEAPRRLRVIDSIGPSPMPPWVISTRTPGKLRGEVRALLLAMHMNPGGRELLARGGFERFVKAHDRDYDPIRRMAAAAAAVSLA